MAVDVKVSVTDRAIISALNTPGGAVFEWRDQIGEEIKLEAQRLSPVNDVLNAQHRNEVVGTYQAAWDWNRIGSGGHRVRAVVFNTADHAVYVEYGRSSSRKMQIFSWKDVVINDVAHPGAIVRTGGPKPLRPLRGNPSPRALARRQRLEDFIAGLPPKIGDKTAARPGNHVLSRAVVAVLGSQGIAARTDL